MVGKADKDRGAGKDLAAGKTDNDQAVGEDRAMDEADEDWEAHQANENLTAS